jgi:hypothetical protein
MGGKPTFAKREGLHSSVPLRVGRPLRVTPRRFGSLLAQLRPPELNRDDESFL